MVESRVSRVSRAQQGKDVKRVREKERKAIEGYRKPQWRGDKGVERYLQ